MSDATKGASLNAAAPEWRPAALSQPVTLAVPEAPKAPEEPPVAVATAAEPEKPVEASDGPKRSLRPGGSATGRWARGQKLAPAPEDKPKESSPSRWSRRQRSEAAEEPSGAPKVENWRAHHTPVSAVEARVDSQGRRVYTVDALFQLRPRSPQEDVPRGLNLADLGDPQHRPALLRLELEEGVSPVGRDAQAFSSNGSHHDSATDNGYANTNGSGHGKGNGSGNGNGRNHHNHSGNRRNRRGRGREHETAPLPEDCEPLAINDATRWKARVMDPNAAVDEKEVFERRLLSLLNKLTLDLFAKISGQIVELAGGVGDEEQLAILAGAIVQKAQNEQHFCAMYAELCRTLGAKPLLDDSLNKPKAFKNALLAKSKEEFDDDLASRMQRATEYADEQDLDEGDRSIHLIKTKRQYLGLMKFLGELFQKDLLREKIVHEVVHVLLADAEANLDEESLECVCKLLTTVGYKLEFGAQKMKYVEFVALYFRTLEELGEDPKLPSRVRFMCKDVVELRGNNYELRRKEEVARTLKEVRAEAAAEQERQEAMKGRNGRRGRKDDKGGSRDHQRSSAAAPSSLPPAAAADGWNVASGSTRTKVSAKPKLRPTASASSQATSTNSMFAMLNMDASDDRKEKKKKKKKDKKEKEEKKKKSKKDRSDSNRNAEDVTPEISPVPSPTTVPTMSKDAAERGCWEAVEEYGIGRDEAELLRCLRDCAAVLENHDGAWLVPSVIMTKSFEQKEEARVVAADCVAKGARENLLGFDSSSLHRAINEQLELLWDFKIDIPRIEEYVASFVGPLLAQRSISLKFLETSPESFRRPDSSFVGANAADFVVKCVVSAKAHGYENAQELLDQDGGFDFSTCLPEGTEDPQAAGSRMMTAALQ